MNPTFPQSARTFRLVLLLAGVLLAMPQMALAQSAWTSPFDPAPEEEQEETTPWGAPGENPTYSNPWGVDDGWGTDDPWGTEDRWDTDNPWGTGSDWSDDFYDFDDENSGSSDGTANRVGDGPTTMAEDGEECSRNSDCDSGICCTQTETCQSGGNPTAACRSSGGGSSDPIRDDEEIDDDGNVVCTNPDDNADCDNDTPVVPIDGGLIYLIVMGVAYGAYKLRGF